MEVNLDIFRVFLDGLFAFAFVTFEEVVGLLGSILTNKIFIRSNTVPMHIDLAIPAIDHQI